MRKTIAALALVLMASVPARAQQHEHGQMEHGGMAQMMMMLHHGAHAALMHREDLALDAGQVRRLSEVDSLQTQAMREHCAQVRAAGGPNEQTHAAMHPAMMASLQGFQRQVEGILTAPQKAKLDSLMQAHHAQMAGMAGHDMSAMHQQMHGGDAAQHDSMHAAHPGDGGEHACMDGCTDAACCHAMGCDEHGEHAEHAGHTAG